MTFRRVALLTGHLRPGSRLAQVRLADDAWTQADYFSAATLDALHHNTWATINRGVERKKQTDQPTPLERPADLREKRDHASRQLERARAFKRHFSK